MATSHPFGPAYVTGYTLAAGAAGAGLGYLASFPVFVLTGPAILITLLSLAGIRFEIAPMLRDAALLLIGVSIGAGINSQASAAFSRWPVAFVVLAVMLIAMMLVSRRLLMRQFHYDARSAVLAATPGHLSFVLGLSATLKLNVAQISVVQAVRIFSLTMLVPFLAVIFGIDLNSQPAPVEPAMTVVRVLIVIAAGLAGGLVLKKLRAPAPMLIGGLFVSALFHVSNLTPGPLSPTIAMPAFMVLGTLIGTRFSGVSLSILKNSLLAGLSTTGVAMSFAFIAALPVAAYLQIPLLHVMVAFAPGGLETMVAMGAVLGVSPGFVAASHVARLLMLVVIVPAMLPADERTRGNTGM